MKITLDTNVLYQALRSNSGAYHAILGLIRKGEIELALSIPVFTEYKDVLSRKKTLEDLELTKNEITDVLDFIAYIGYPQDISFNLRPNLKDEKDNIFIELAFASNSKFIVTSNIKDFRTSQLTFDSFRITTPTEFMNFWRKSNG